MLVYAADARIPCFQLGYTSRTISFHFRPTQDALFTIFFFTMSHPWASVMLMLPCLLSSIFYRSALLPPTAMRIMVDGKCISAQ